LLLNWIKASSALVSIFSLLARLEANLSRRIARGTAGFV
jgi:hypothetical protein